MLSAATLAVCGGIDRAAGSSRRSTGRDLWSPRLTLVSNWESEKQMATQLRKLRREVKRLTEEIRGSAIPTRRPSSGPSFPTDPERRLRLVLNDGDEHKK